MVQINSDCTLAQMRYWSESSNRFYFRKECKPQKKILPANSLTLTLPPPQSPLFVFEWRTLTGSRRFTFLGSVFAQIFGHIVVLRVKELSNTNLFALRHMLREKVSLPVDVRRSETALLKFPFLCGEEAGEKGKESALSIFSRIAIFIGIPSGSLYGGEISQRENSLRGRRSKGN